ncbi:MAG: hypothetical protein M3378_12950 [Actinomycetota bacterium]|nr:hypothetical protein [Actinomycetota bacterium]
MASIDKRDNGHYPDPLEGPTPWPPAPRRRPRSEIQGWVKRVSDVLAPTTLEVVYRWVATIFKAAVADRLIPASPYPHRPAQAGPQRGGAPRGGPGRGHGRRRQPPLPAHGHLPLQQGLRPGMRRGSQACRTR